MTEGTESAKVEAVARILADAFDLQNGGYRAESVANDIVCTVCPSFSGDYPFYILVENRLTRRCRYQWWVTLKRPNREDLVAGPFRSKEYALKVGQEVRVMFREAWDLGLDQALKGRK